MINLRELTEEELQRLVELIDNHGLIHARWPSDNAQTPTRRLVFSGSASIEFADILKIKKYVQKRDDYTYTHISGNKMKYLLMKVLHHLESQKDRAQLMIRLCKLVNTPKPRDEQILSELHILVQELRVQ